MPDLSEAPVTGAKDDAAEDVDIDDIVCHSCGSGDSSDSNDIVLCDNCNLGLRFVCGCTLNHVFLSGFHQKCLRPALVLITYNDSGCVLTVTTQALFEAVRTSL